MRIIGLGVCGPGEADRYLEKTLEEYKRLCDDVLICGNNIDHGSERLIRKYKFRLTYDNREWGIAQPKIKEQLLRKARQLQPDWCLFLDMDEVFVEGVSRKTLENLASQKHDIAYFFWVLELWDTPLQYREDFLFDTIRYFKYLPDKIRFNPAPLHCGNVPEEIGQWGTHTDIAFKHYGLMLPEERERKYQRYRKYDPQGKWLTKDWYAGLLHKHPALKDCKEFYMQNVPPTKFRQKPVVASIPMTAKKTWRFLNPHGKEVVVEKLKNYEELIHRRGFQFLGES